MSSSKFNTPSPARKNAGNMSPLTAKPMSQLNSYNKENLSGPGSPQAPRSNAPNSKLSHRLSLPMSLSNGESRSPFKSRSQAASGSKGPVLRRGRVTDGGATSSLLAGASEALNLRTPIKRQASMAELDDPQLAAKRPRMESGQSPFFSKDQAIAIEGLEDSENVGAPAVKDLDTAPTASPFRDDHRELVALPDYPSVDAQFEAIWGEVTRTTGASKYGDFAEGFDDEEAFGEWRDQLLNHEDVQQQRGVEQSSRNGGDTTKKHGDLLQEENRVDVLGVTTVPVSNDFEALLPLPLALALRACRGLSDRAEHHLLVPKVPFAQQAVVLSATPASDLPSVQSPRLPEVLEQEDAGDFLPAAEEDAGDFLPAAEEDAIVAPELPQATVTKSIEADEAGRKPRAARVRSEARRHLAPPARLLAPASREATPHPPQTPKPQVPQADKAKSTGRRTRSTRAQSNAPEQGAPISTSSRPVTLEPIPEVPQPPRDNGGKSTGGKKPARRAKGSKAPSNGILGSSVAGPSNSTSAAQDLYSPALAQQIWALSEAGKWRKALRLFPREESLRHIVGEAKVRAYLHDHPEAAKALRPLKDGKPRRELFICRSRTFWELVEKKEGQAEGPRQFELQHHAENCVKGYVTEDNYNKHVYRNHLQKEYKSYAEGHTSAKGKGKATKKSRTPKKEDDEYSDGDEEDNEDC